MRLIYIAIGWSAGIILADRLENPYLPVIWLGLAAFLCVLVWMTRHEPPLWMVNLTMVALALGGFRYALAPVDSAVSVWNQTGGLTLEGVVIDDPDLRDDRVQFRLQTETMTRGADSVVTGGLVLVEAPRVTDIAYGDRVAVTGELITPAEFDTFSYAAFLARQNVYSIMPNAIVDVQSGGHGVSFYATLFDWRGRANDSIDAALPEPQAGLLAGILLGNERGIAPEVSDAFSATGAAHIIAISGFNMALIAGIVMGTNAEDRRMWRVIVGVLVIGAYTLFVGANAAVVRAALMSSLLVIGQLFKRRAFVPTSLAFAAMLMSLLDPDVLWDVSFQLSFFATLGIALFVEPLQRGFDRLLAWTLPTGAARTIAGALQEPIVVTLAAQITTLPLIVLYFERLSLVTLPVNLLIISVQPYILIAGGLATIIAFGSPFFAGAVYGVAYVLLSWTTEIVRFFGGLDFADVAFRVDADIIALYFVGLIGWAIMHATQPQWWLNFVVFIRRQSVLSAVMVAGVSTVVLMGAIAFSRPDDRLHVWFLDMGHSNAVLVQTPGGAQILVDGGRFPSRLLTAIGDRVPFNDREIDVLAITHPDEFDIAALPAVLARYRVGLAITNGQPNIGDVVLEIEEALSATSIVVVTAGYTLDFDDGTRLEVLHPQQTPDIADRIGDEVMVLRLSYGDISFLLTSDISEAAQAELIDAGHWPLSTVLQLPQHGTARSLNDTFLAAVQPAAAVIQVDRANRRGDPDTGVLAMLPEGVPVYRTDESDTLHFWTDGVDLWLEG